MLASGYTLLACLVTVTLLRCYADGFRLAPETPEHMESVGLKGSIGLARSNGESPGRDMTDKLKLLNQLVRLENDVIETKRKRSFPAGNTPVDRLSISTMDVKSKQKYHPGEGGSRKAVEVPRRRMSAPIDRIGVGRLPSPRG